MERVVNQLILQSQNLQRRVSSLEFILESYHEWKKDTEDFSKFLREKVAKLDEDRAGNSVSDKRRQKTSKQVQSSNS